MQPISRILAAFVPGQEIECLQPQYQLEEPGCEDFTGREEWEVIEGYRVALTQAGIDLSDLDLGEAIAGYPQNVEIGILKFLSSQDKTTSNLIFCIKQGGQP